MQKPELLWKNKHTPYSSEFEDCYYSHIDGLKESEYVFITSNQLEKRWNTKKSFTVFELGFGTGLNFFATLKLWNALEDKKATKLHFISCELNPLTPQQINQALSHWPELNELKNSFLKQYQNSYLHFDNGFYRFELSSDVCLSLYIGDVKDALSQFHGVVDAWYLDGFAPSKNPKMWSQDVFNKAYELSQNETTLATFSAASQVRKNLIEAGFDVQKQKGFSGKREMLIGSVSDKKPNKKLKKAIDTPWFSYPAVSNVTDVAIIGGGVAGTSLVDRFASRKIKVKLIEKENTLAKRASGNLAAIYMPLFGAKENIQSNFILKSFNAFENHLMSLSQNGFDNFNRCGVMQLMTTDEQKVRFKSSINRLSYTKDFVEYYGKNKVEDLSGIKLNYEGVLFKKAGWVDPVALCKARIEQASPFVVVAYENEAVSVIKNTKNSNWLIKNKSGKIICETKAVVIANGIDCNSYAQTSWLPLGRLLGQVTHIQSEKLKDLKCILNFDGYLTPSLQNGMQLMGATHQRLEPNQTIDLSLKKSAQDYLYQQLSQVVDANVQFNPELLGKVDVRCISPDNLPVIGPVPDFDKFSNNYSELWKGNPRTVYSSGPVHSGLYLSVGHGARGVLSSYLGAELVVSQVLGEPFPIERSLVQAVHPARFIIKNLKK